MASYRLIGVLGGGGMGRVYLAESRAGRRVAIKVVRDELAEDPVFRRRFAREVAAAKVVSPLYTAAVVDADPDAESPWLATTYIDGPNLTELVLNEGPLSPRAVLTLAAGLSEALASIHRVGLVHRDLKPSNVIINGAGPHIIDFGIALTTETTGRLTTSKVVGTPSYIAPEIIQGSDPSPAGDVFSLGASLYFAASGKHLVADGTVYAQILQITSGKFDLDAVPKELRPLIVRCISPEPKDRPTADELAHILVASGVSPPTPGWYSSKEPAPTVFANPDPKTLVSLSRRRLLAIGGLVGAAAVGSAIGVVAGLTGRSATSADAAWRGVTATPTVTGSPTPPPARTGPGSVVWDGASPAEPTGTSPGAQQPGVRVIVDPGPRLIASSGSEVVAVDPAGAQLWHCPLPTSAVNLRPWGDAVLATDSNTAWLIDMASGAVLASKNLVDEEKIDAVNDNPDNLAIQIGAIALSQGQAFIGLGTSVAAYDRSLKQQWRVPRPYGHRASPVPRVANDKFVAVHTVEGTLVQVTLRDVAKGERQWFVSYDPGAVSLPAGGPPPNDPPPSPGAGGATAAPPPQGPPPTNDSWSLSEGHFGASTLALRDSSSLRVLSLSQGATMWQKAIDKPVAATEVLGDMFIVAADKITAYALDRDETRWYADMRGARIVATPDGTQLIAVTETTIAAFDRDGKRKWQAQLPPSGAGHAPDRITTDGHTAFLTFDPGPDQQRTKDTIAILIDG